MKTVAIIALAIVLISTMIVANELADANYKLTHFKAECDGTVIVVESTRGAEFVSSHCDQYKVLPL